LPYVVHHAGVGRRVRAGRGADGRLVHDDRVGVLTQESLVDQGALAGAGHAGDRDEHAGGDVDADVLEVVGAGVADGQFAGRPAGRLFYPQGAAGGGGGAGGRPLRLEELGVAALEDDLAAGAAGPRAHVDHVVGDLDDVGV